MFKPRPKSQVPLGIYIQKDGRYRAVARTCRADRKDKVFETQAEAEEWRANAMTFLTSGKPIPSSQSQLARPTTVGQLCRLWLLEWQGDNPDLSPEQLTKRRNQTNVIGEWFGSRDFTTVRRLKVKAFRTHLGQSRVKSTANDYLYVLKHGFDLAIGEGWISVNPAHDVHAVDLGAGSPLGARPRIDPAIAQTIPTMLRPSFRLAFWCQLLTGLRRGELFGLKVKDVDFGEHIIHVRRQRGLWRKVSGEVTFIKPYPKGGKPRTAALPKLLERMLDLHLIQTGKVSDPEAFVFDLPKSSNEPYQRELRDALGKLNLLSANGKAVGTHNLRHEYINLLIEFSGDGALASRAAGHEVTAAGRTTRKHYIHKLLSAREVRRIRKHMHKYIRVSLGGTLNMGAPEWRPGSEWVSIQEAAAMLGFSSVASVRALVKKGELEQYTHHPMGQNVSNAFVRKSGVEKMVTERDSHMSLAAAGLDLGIGRMVTRAMSELRLAQGRSGVSTAQLKQLKAYVATGKQFRKTHLNRTEICALLNIRSCEVSAKVAGGALIAVTPQGFQPEGFTTWFAINQVNAIICSMAPMPNRIGAHSVSASGQIIGVSDATVRRLIASGDLISVRWGKRVLVTDRSVQSYLAVCDARIAKLTS